MVGVRVEERADDSVRVPVASKAETEHAVMFDVAHDTVAVRPANTRLGVAVKLVIDPFGTQMLPPCTWTWPAGQVQLGE